MVAEVLADLVVVDCGLSFRGIYFTCLEVRSCRV